MHYDLHHFQLILKDGNPSTVNGNLTMRDGDLAMADGNLMTVDKNKDNFVEPAYHNPHYFDSQYLMKKDPEKDSREMNADRSNADPVTRDYQRLDTTTMDYISVYARPVKGREGDSVPKIEVEGKFYTVVNKDKTKQHTYTSLTK